MPRLTPLPQHTDRVARRVVNLERFLRRIAPMPEEVVAAERQAQKERHRLRPLACRSWEEVRASWDHRTGGAVRWRQCLEDILVSSLAVAISTQQQGEQVFLLVVGPPGAGKTRIVSSLLVSDHCYPFENLSGMFSGWRSGFGDDDYSMLARMNGKTLITPEGDVLVNSKNFDETMANLRRIFDGSISQDYKTLKEQRRYDGLRCPIIIAGTHVMMRVMSQPQKGDRFLRIVADKPPASEERAILLNAAGTAWNSVGQTSNCSPDTQMSPKITKAYQLTGGYLNHLRERASELIGNVQGDVLEPCSDLAQFTSHLRGRPAMDRWNRQVDEAARREMPARLVQQYARLARCVAAVTGKREVDHAVMRVVRKVALDTSDEKMLALAKLVHTEGAEGAYANSLARWMGVTDERMHGMVQYLAEIGTVVPAQSGGAPGSDAYARWRLSDEMTDVWHALKEM